MTDLLLSPLAALYSGVMTVRNRLYDRAWIRPVRAYCPVISVGNLTMGGTGKTPLVSLIAGALEARRLNVLILSRGYGARVRGVLRVDPTAADAPARFGDEPVLLARRHRSVFVTRNRSREAPGLSKRERPDVMVLDDGFQHRALARDLDIVAIDASRGAADLRVVPLGRGRETAGSLGRASLVILTKTNLASPADVAAIQELIPNGVPVIEAEYALEAAVTSDGRESRPVSGLGPLTAAAAIANPKSFESLLKQAGADVKALLPFPDHHRFTETDLARLAAAAAGGTKLIVTEKDAVKLGGLKSPYWVARLALKLTKNKEALDESLDRVLR
ncbi:MAG TPA: tetraacyldisaccharide 4'-kinase [Bdellovibrionales bacterium]|nr:tetraacyldisaccharide 4'-kinase [Bdellovibrionales bacterium]